MKLNLSIFLFFLILISCDSKKNSTQNNNLMLQNLLDKKNEAFDKNNFNIMSKIMEPKLLSDSSKLASSSVSNKKQYVQYSKNEKYISQQWFITNIKANEKILITYKFPSSSITSWEFYTGASILNKNDDVRKKRFIGLAHELTKKNNISFIYKDNKNFLIKFKEKNDRGYSFISYTNQASIYSIKKCDDKIDFCLGN